MRATKLAALAATLVVTGCGQTVAGTPEPNPEAARLATGTTVDKAVAAMTTFITKVQDFRSLVFTYAAVNERKTGSDIELSLKGDPPATIVKNKSKTPPGFDFDRYQPAGSPLEYVKLGPQYAKLAPTSWVSVPAVASTGSACYMLQTLCKINDAILATEKAAPPGLTESASRTADGGIEVRTGVSLKAFVDRGVITFPADIAALIEPAMMDRVVPAKIVLSQDGTLRQAEIRGEVRGQKTNVQIEVGFEHRGRTAAGDFPPVPQPAEVTAISDKAAVDEFWQKIAGGK